NNSFGMRANYDINIIKAITDMGTSVKPAIIDNINAGLSSANITSVNANGLISQISDLTNHFTVAGIDLTVNPTLAFNIYIIIPILTFVFAFFSTKIIRKFTYQTQQAKETQSSMAMMDWTMPLLSVWISFSLPSAIAIYWMLQNILSAVQQIVLYKMYPIPPVTDEELKEAELKLKGKYSEKARNVVLEDPDYSSPIYEEVPEPDFEEKTSISVSSGPNGLTNKIKRRLKETNKPLKARRKI
ncbi:MAG: YidC/Oxa1 family membrane protein insertase, partial [Clostridia bacterium]|nr:YidC/Oxa1 family membrane protein insertase [Clostridia bacterium]